MDSFLQEHIDTEDTFYGMYLAEEKVYDRFIKSLEMTIRHSYEYKAWASYSKSIDGMYEHKCPICQGNYEYLKKETHHFPKDLYTLVETELQYLIDTDKLDSKYVTPTDIIKTINDKHINCEVGFVNLCKGCHELFHNMHGDTRQAVKDIFDAYYHKLYSKGTTSLGK